MRLRRLSFVWLASGFLLGLSHDAWAQPKPLPSVDELLRKLAPSGSTGVAPEALPSGTGSVASPVRKPQRTRGMVIADEDAPPASPASSAPASAVDGQTMVRQAEAPAREAVSPAPKSVQKYSESRITFEVGSDKLTPYARQVLDVFGAAIRSPQLSSVSFIIEGHTDANGSDAYNLDLSRRRADSVVRYLVDVQGVDPSRLSSRGMGRRELVNLDDPGAAENRRVVWLSQR